MSIVDRVLWILLGLSVGICALAIVTSSSVGLVVALPSAAIVSFFQAKRE